MATASVGSTFLKARQVDQVAETVKHNSGIDIASGCEDSPYSNDSKNTVLTDADETNVNEDAYQWWLLRL